MMFNGDMIKMADTTTLKRSQKSNFKNYKKGWTSKRDFDVYEHPNDQVMLSFVGFG